MTEKLKRGWYKDENGHKVYVYDVERDVHYVCVRRGIKQTNSAWVKNLTPLPNCDGWDWEEVTFELDLGN